MSKINEESMRKAFNAKYPEFSTILMLHEEKSIGVSGIETIVPRHALANFKAGYEAAQALLSQGEPVGYIEVNQYNEYRLEPADLFDYSKIEKDIKHNIYLSPPSTEALQKENAELLGKLEQLKLDKAELIDYAKMLPGGHKANSFLATTNKQISDFSNKSLSFQQPKCMEK